MLQTASTSPSKIASFTGLSAARSVFCSATFFIFQHGKGVFALILSLGPVLAYIFICDFEEKCLLLSAENSPSFWNRCVGFPFPLFTT